MIPFTKTIAFYAIIFVIASCSEISNPVGDGSGTQNIFGRDFPLGNTGKSIRMVWIPAGSFVMGSPETEQDRRENEGPVHTVAFANGFWIGKYEVTQGQWQAVMGNNPAHGQGEGDDFPVYFVSWNNTQEFLLRLNGAFRLPSEAEWEYACRAGTKTRFYWGDDPDYTRIDAYAWYPSNAHNLTHPVGKKKANNWGVHDMSGNVLEWCMDCYQETYIGAPVDGSVWIDPLRGARIIRGGSWSSAMDSYFRSSTRSGNEPQVVSNSQGFRVVADSIP